MVYIIQVCWQLANRIRTERPQAVSKPLWRIPLMCVQWKISGDEQKNCPKHVEFYSKNELEKLVHLVGFIIRIYHDARSPERQIRQTVEMKETVLEFSKTRNARITCSLNHSCCGSSTMIPCVLLYKNDFITNICRRQQWSTRFPCKVPDVALKKKNILLVDVLRRTLRLNQT